MGFHSLVEDFDLTQAQVAERVGKSRVWSENSIRLLQLSEALRKFLIEGRLTVGHAKYFLVYRTRLEERKLERKQFPPGGPSGNVRKQLINLLIPKPIELAQDSHPKGSTAILPKVSNNNLDARLKLLGVGERKERLPLGSKIGKIWTKLFPLQA